MHDTPANKFNNLLVRIRTINTLLNVLLGVSRMTKSSFFSQSSNELLKPKNLGA